MKKKVIFLAIFQIIISFSCQNPPRLKTYTYYNGDSNLKPIDFSRTLPGHKIEELTGVALEIQNIKGTDEEAEARAMLAINNFPDMIYGHNAMEFFVESKVLIPLNDLIEKYGPNIKKYYGKNLNKFRKEDGNIYYIGPNLRPSDVLYGDAGFWLPL